MDSIRQVVTQLHHIWQLICCVITNKICQRSSVFGFFAEFLTWCQVASDGADLSNANWPPSRRAAPFKFNTEVSPHVADGRQRVRRAECGLLIARSA